MSGETHDIVSILIPKLYGGEDRNSWTIAKGLETNPSNPDGDANTGRRKTTHNDIDSKV